MKKAAFVLALIVCQLSFSPAGAQTARQVLDKAAAAVSNQGGVQADFTMTGATGTTSGTIAIKGQKFQAITPQASVWYDGTTQWTYLKKNDEVSVTTPTQAQQQAINPYTFINMYKKGYKLTMNQSGSEYVVHLTATDTKARIPEMFINVSKSGNAPTQVKMLQGKKWTTFTISNLKKATLSDATFRFNSKDFPTAEVIDLR